MQEEPTDLSMASSELRDAIASADAHSEDLRAKASALDNSRELFMHRWSRTHNFKKLSSAVYDRLFPDIHIRHRQSWKRQLRIILADLFHCYYSDPERFVRVSLNKAEYKTGNRYRRLTLTYPITSAILRRLRDEELLIWHRGYFDRTKGEGRKTRMSASQKLIDLFAEFRVGIQDIEQLPRELIILRDANGEDVDYKDTELTNRIREELIAYNQHLALTHIDLELKEYSEDIKVDLSAKTVHRVFNNESWLQGGRFHGAWWMNVPKALRQRIVLNHKATREIDYSRQHIALAYARKGIDYFGSGNEDPYFTDLAPDGLTPEEVRESCKKVLLSAINASSRSKALGGVRKEWFDEGKYDLLRRASPYLRQLLEDMIKRHSSIEELICSGIGLELQNEDACIAERVIRAFLEVNRPILTIHDSFVVQVADVDLLQKAMDRAFIAHVGEDHGIEVTCRYKEKYFYSTGLTPYDPPNSKYVTDDLHELLRHTDLDQWARFEAFKKGEKQAPLSHVAANRD